MPIVPVARRSRWCIGALLVFAALTSQTASANKNKARDSFRKGMAEYVLEHYDAAIDSFELGFKEEQEPAFLFNIAQSHRKAHRPALAIRYFQKYLEFAPDAPDRPSVEKAMVEEEAALAALSSTTVAPASRSESVTAAASPSSAAIKTDLSPTGTGAGTVGSSQKSADGATLASGRGEAPAPSGATATTDPGQKKPADGESALPSGLLPAFDSPSPTRDPSAPVKVAPAPKQRWKLWVAIGAAIAVVVGAGVSVAVAETVPRDAPIPGTTLGTISFP